ncbi:MAG: class I SAM-dependent methyltransferase [Candidatus Brocadiaceae bacterium]|jgi:ubiquinone/menaquinone biosynthesis C-methylase UbiE
MELTELLTPLERALEPEAMAAGEEAVVYDELARAHWFLDELFVRKATRMGVERGRALDVGCGPGHLCALLAQRLPGLDVVAVDLSDSMLELAAHNLGRAGAERVRLVHADAKHLPFEEECFDLVFSQHTLHHIPDPRALLLEMKRVTRPDGRLFVRDLRRPPVAGMMELYVRTFGHIYDRLGDHAEAGKAQYRDSLAAALSSEEWVRLAERCGIPATCVSAVPLINHVDILFRKEG